MPRIRLCSRPASDGPSVGTTVGNPVVVPRATTAAEFVVSETPSVSPELSPSVEKSVIGLLRVPLCAGRPAAATGFVTEINCDPPLMTADASFGLLGSITRLRYISLATTRGAPFEMYRNLVI